MMFESVSFRNEIMLFEIFNLELQIAGFSILFLLGL